MLEKKHKQQILMAEIDEVFMRQSPSPQKSPITRPQRSPKPKRSPPLSPNRQSSLKKSTIDSPAKLGDASLPFKLRTIDTTAF